jgi:hypothetical protein
MHRGPGFSLISKTRRLPSGRSAWAKSEARLTAERQAAILELSVATTTTLAEVRLLAGGSSHLQEVTRDMPIIGLLQKTCASISMKAAMHGPWSIPGAKCAKKSRRKVLIAATISQLSPHDSAATSTLRASNRSASPSVTPNL